MPSILQLKKKSLKNPTVSSSKTKPLPIYLQGWTILTLILKHNPRSHLSLSHVSTLYWHHINCNYWSVAVLASFPTPPPRFTVPSSFPAAPRVGLQFWHSHRTAPAPPWRDHFVLGVSQFKPEPLVFWAKLVLIQLLWTCTLLVTCECMQSGLTLCRVLSYIYVYWSYFTRIK